MVRTNVNFARVFGTNPGYNDGNGWTNFDRFPRQVGDVNGDGRADIVGFGGDQVYVALGQANGTFGSAFPTDPTFRDNTGWSVGFNRLPRQIGDVNGDGRADIVGFGINPVYVALGQADGTFGTAFPTDPGYKDSTGWGVGFNRLPRQVGDVNGDGRADIVGFGYDQVYVALGQANGTFGTAFPTNPGYNDSNGWTSFDRYPRQLGDVNGDGRADIVGFGGDQVYVALARITPVNNNPNISINDVRLFEGNSGNKTARFTVTLTGRTQENVSVLYSTANGTATAGSDFTPLVGTLSFIRSNATRQTQTISIPVRGDRTPERDETFFVNLSSAINADIRDSRGIGTIKNDDDSLMKFLDDFSQGSPLNAGLDQIGSVFLSK